MNLLHLTDWKSDAELAITTEKELNKHFYHMK